MSQEQHNAAPKPGRWALCWRIARGSYFRLNRASHHVLGFTLKLLLLAYFVFCALFLVLRYAVLPEIGHYKPRIEHLVSAQIGRAVSIEAAPVPQDCQGAVQWLVTEGAKLEGQP